MDPLTLYGLSSLMLGLCCYTLEDRHRHFVLGFGAACVLSAAYGFLAHTWPFGVVEGVWALIAVRRWRRAAGEQAARGHRARPDGAAR